MSKCHSCFPHRLYMFQRVSHVSSSVYMSLILNQCCLKTTAAILHPIINTLNLLLDRRAPAVQSEACLWPVWSGCQQTVVPVMLVQQTHSTSGSSQTAAVCDQTVEPKVSWDDCSSLYSGNSPVTLTTNDKNLIFLSTALCSGGVSVELHCPKKHKMTQCHQRPNSSRDGQADSFAELSKHRLTNTSCRIHKQADGAHVERQAATSLLCQFNGVISGSSNSIQALL